MKRILLALLFLTKISFAQTNTDWNGTVTFPADFKVGDYKEFIVVHPINAYASGNYEISISYDRGNVAAGGTYLSGISHSNPDIWREVGRINNNGYLSSDGYCFTVDCNPQYGNSRFRIRAIKILGVETNPVTVNIKIRSVSQNGGWTIINNSGNDLAVNKFQPMTNDWSLYVGNSRSLNGANLALKAIENGNVGVGTATPAEKLSVNGKIRAHEIKVETNNWPDYVFEENYKLLSLKELELFIKLNKHLPDVPTAEETKANGLSLGEMNTMLLKKLEELTLHLIAKDKELNIEKETNKLQEQKISLIIKNLNELRKTAIGAPL